MKLITNAGWCWTPRCELCAVCTGGRLLTAQLSGVSGDDASCGVCPSWNVDEAGPIPLTQSQECLWEGDIGFCSGRIEFGLDNTFAPPFVLLEGSIYEIAVNGPEVGNEVFIGDWRSLAGTTKVDCNFDNTLLGAFVPSAYQLNNGWQQCNFALSQMRISKVACEEEIV